jgi:hypothetical protein
MEAIILKDLDEWYTQLQDYDVIAFGVDKSLVSRAIKFFQDLELGRSTKWMHVGVVVPEDFQFEGKVENERYIIEAIISGPINDGIMDAITNSPTNGVQIRNLKQILAKHHKRKDFAAFRVNFDTDMDNLLEQFVEFWQNYSSKPYDFFHCLNAVIPKKLQHCFFPTMSRDEAMFCSEMAVRLYQFLGYIDPRVNPELFSPEELVALPIFTKSLILEKNKKYKKRE